ncbi:hypothetical protein Hanom_Chr16g01453151 [Helianthus anomalus]
MKESEEPRQVLTGLSGKNVEQKRHSTTVASSAAAVSGGAALNRPPLSLSHRFSLSLLLPFSVSL